MKKKQTKIGLQSHTARGKTFTIGMTVAFFDSAGKFCNGIVADFRPDVGECGWMKVEGAEGEEWISIKNLLDTLKEEEIFLTNLMPVQVDIKEVREKIKIPKPSASIGLDFNNTLEGANEFIDPTTGF